MVSQGGKKNKQNKKKQRFLKQTAINPKKLSKRERIKIAKAQARENTIEHKKEIGNLKKEIERINRLLARPSLNPRHRAQYLLQKTKAVKKVEDVQGLASGIEEASFWENNLDALESAISRSRRKDDPNRSLAEWRPYGIFQGPPNNDGVRPLTVHIEQNNTINTPGVFHKQVTTTTEKRVTDEDLHGAMNIVSKDFYGVNITLLYSDYENHLDIPYTVAPSPILNDNTGDPYGYLVQYNDTYTLLFHSLTRGLTVAETKMCIVNLNIILNSNPVGLNNLKKVLYSNKFTLDQNHVFQHELLNSYKNAKEKQLTNQSGRTVRRFGMMHVTNRALLSQVISEFSFQYFEFKNDTAENYLLNGGVRLNATSRNLFNGRSPPLTASMPMVGTEGIPLANQPGNIACRVANGIIVLTMDRSLVVNAFCGCPHLNDETGLLCNNSGTVFHLKCDGTVFDRQGRCRRALARTGNNLPRLPQLQLDIGNAIFNNLGNTSEEFVNQCLRYMDFIHDFATKGRDVVGFDNEVECASILQLAVDEAARDPPNFANSPEKLFLADFLLNKHTQQGIAMDSLAHNGDELFGFLIRTEPVSVDTRITNQEGLITWLTANYPKHILAPDVLNIRKNGISQENKEKIKTIFSGESLRYDLGYGPAGLVTYAPPPP